MDLKIIAKEIRDEIKKYQENNSLSFIEDTHTYFIKDENGNITSDMPSVSTVLKSFYTEFDATTTKAFRDCGGDPKKEQQLLNEWAATGDYATNMGSRVHFLLEKYLVDLYGSYKEVRQPIFECDEEQINRGDQMIVGGKYFIKLMHERGAVLLDTEMVLGNRELGYFGQPDKVWLIKTSEDNFGIVITDWKGLPLDTPVLTDKGWKTMGSLCKSDKVFDKEGKLVNILNISKVKNKKCLKIIFDNNEEIVSDFEHRWLVYTKNGNKKKERVMTTQEIKDYNDSITRHSYNILKIENAKPLNNKNIKLPIDPYVLGVWLGDGHSIDAKITQANKKVWEEIKKRGYDIGDDVSQGGAGLASTRTIFNLQKELRKNNLIKNKHVPDIYLLSSYEQRLDLLRGLMDSDGTFNKKRNRFSISTTKKCQVEFSTKIISSLGIKTTTLKYFKNINGKKIQCYNVEFKTDSFNPFLIRNQDLNLKTEKDKHTFRAIKNVEEIDSVPTICIEVDSPSSTFLIGHSLLVTHNTNKIKNFQVQHYTKKMLTPFENLYDNALGHYYVQLPLYGKLLLKMLEGTKYENTPILGAIVTLLKDDGTFQEFRVPKEVYNTVFEMDVKKYIKNKN